MPLLSLNRKTRIKIPIYDKKEESLWKMRKGWKRLKKC